MLNLLETFMPWATIQKPSKAVLYAQGRIMPHTSVVATAGVLKHHPSSLENTPASSRGNCAKSLFTTSSSIRKLLRAGHWSSSAIQFFIQPSKMTRGAEISCLRHPPTVGHAANSRRYGCIMLHPFVHQSRREKGPVNGIPMCLDLTSAKLLHFTMHVFCGSKPATFGEPSKMTRLVLGAMFIIPIPDPGAQGVSARCREHLRTVGGLTPWSGLPWMRHWPHSGPENCGRTNPLVRPIGTPLGKDLCALCAQCAWVSIWHLHHWFPHLDPFGWWCLWGLP